MSDRACHTQDPHPECPHEWVWIGLSEAGHIEMRGCPFCRTRRHYKPVSDRVEWITGDATVDWLRLGQVLMEHVRALAEGAREEVAEWETVAERHEATVRRLDALLEGTT